MAAKEWLLSDKKIGIADVVLLVHFLRPSYNHLPSYSISKHFLFIHEHQAANKDRLQRCYFPEGIFIFFAVMLCCNWYFQLCLFQVGVVVVDELFRFAILRMMLSFKVYFSMAAITIRFVA